MHTNNIIIAFILLSLFVSCGGNSETKAVLDKVENSIQEHPDSALIALETIDTAKLRDKSDKARYSLLMAMALDKNGVDDGSYLEKSRMAESYYEKNGSEKYRMLSSYYCADQWKDKEEYEEAALNLLKAAKSAEKIGDYFYGGMAYRGLADIFTATYNPQEALMYISKAIDSFTMSGRKPHSFYALVQKAEIYSNARNYEEAIHTYDQAFEIAKDDKDTSEMAEVQRQSASVFLNTEPQEADSAICRFERAVRFGSILNSKNNSDLALAYCVKGERHLTDYYSKLAMAQASGMSDIMYVNTNEYKISLSENNPRKSLALLQVLLSYVDSVTIKTLGESVMKAQNAYYVKRMESEQARLRNSRTVSVMAVIIALLLLFALYLSISLFRSKIKETEAQNIEKIADYDKLVKELREILVKKDSENSVSRYLGSKVMSKWFETFDTLFASYYRNEEDKAGAFLKEFGKITDKLKNDESFYDSLSKSVYEGNRGLFDLLNSRKNTLDHNKKRLLVLLLSGMPYSSISILLSVDKPFLYNRVHRLKNKIAKIIIGSDVTLPACFQSKNNLSRR